MIAATIAKKVCPVVVTTTAKYRAIAVVTVKLKDEIHVSVATRVPKIRLRVVDTAQKALKHI